MFKALASVMKKILLIMISFNFLCCKPEKKELPVEFENTQSQQVEVLNRPIRLPKDYKETTLNRIFEKMANDHQNDDLIEVQHQRLWMLQKNGSKFQVFADQKDVLNTITFMSGKYLYLDKDVLHTYTDILDGQIIPKSADHGIKYHRLESKLLKFGNTKALKIKYQLTNDTNSKYITQYIITTRTKTFSIAVNNKQNIDYEFILKNFKS